MSGAPLAQAHEQLELMVPGNAIPQPLNAPNAPESKVGKGWHAISLSEDVLTVEPVAETIPAGWLTISGKKADRLWRGSSPHMSPKPDGVTMKAPPGTLLLMRLVDDAGDPLPMPAGIFKSSVPASLLRGDWSAPGVVGDAPWKFETRYEKRPDGKLLAGSLQLVATPLAKHGETIVLLPPASRMAFDKQELLWLGDLNGDHRPDALIKRTWVTGEIDYVLVASPLLAFAYVDPDETERYFSSGVAPEENTFRWSKSRPAPAPMKFIGSGRYTIGEEEWRDKLKDNPQLPKTLADRKFKLNGEDLRLTLDYLPRATPKDDQADSTSPNYFWEGEVLVKITFRGKTQVVMQAASPDSGNFTLSVGAVDGKPAIKADYQPHYNNEFTYHWIYDDAAGRFRRVRISQSQGC